MTPPDDFDPPIGTPEGLEPFLRRIVAPNPSPMTYRGTNTYLLGENDIAVIDPGPNSDAHLAAIVSAIQPGQRVSHILVTHAHLDHSPLAVRLKQETGASIYAFGPATAGRSEIMQKLALSGEIGGGEGVDFDFQPDHRLKHGARLTAQGWSIEALHTPGHIGNHISFAWRDRCFTADHVMGWASSLVSPPDGDLTDFMASCALLQARDWSVFYPGHGAPINTPNKRLTWLVNHRKSREAQIRNALQLGPKSAAMIAKEVYGETPHALLGAATRNVLAHLVDLTVKNVAKPVGAFSAYANFELCNDE